MKKLILALSLLFQCHADEKNDIEIAIVRSDIDKLNNLLRKTIAPLDKKKYLELAKDVREKYASVLNDDKYRKLVHFAVGGLALTLGALQLYEVPGQVNAFSDLNKFSVVFGILRAGLLIPFGVYKLHHTYNYYTKNKKYNAALAIEELVINIPVK